jgi:GT2 family glycosyltransferase
MRMSASPLVAIVVVNWHRRDVTLGCLRALRALTYERWLLVLVDNDSTDFTAEEVHTLAPEGRYLRTTANLGFAGGSNAGMRAALETDAAYVWFLNNDAEPEPEALSELVAAAAPDATIGVAGAKILRGNDGERFDSIALDVDLRSGRIYLTGHDEPDHGQYDQLRDPIAVSGCAMLVRRTACEKLGGFDERYFAYLEDADLCLRARVAGFRVIVAPRARVRHQRAEATQGRQSISSLYYTTRNHLRLVDEHGDGGAMTRALRRLAVAWLNAAYALRGASGGKGARLQAVWQGVRDYHRGVVGARPSDL